MKIEPKPTTDTSEKEEIVAKLLILVYLVMLLAIPSIFDLMVLRCLYYPSPSPRAGLLTRMPDCA